MTRRDRPTIPAPVTDRQLGYRINLITRVLWAILIVDVIGFVALAILLWGQT